jgi:NADPH-dependent curcumin reductase CurA
MLKSNKEKHVTGQSILIGAIAFLNARTIDFDNPLRPAAMDAIDILFETLGKFPA